MPQAPLSIKVRNAAASTCVKYENVQSSNLKYQTSHPTERPILYTSFDAILITKVFQVVKIKKKICINLFLFFTYFCSKHR